MNKSEFFSVIESKLSGLTGENIDGIVDYYNEIIDDRIEEGMSEEDAVAAVGSVDDIVSQVLTETLLPEKTRKKIKVKNSMKTWKKVLLIIGAPVWFPLVLATVLVALTIFLLVWLGVFLLYVFDFCIVVCGGYFALSGIACIPLSIFQGILIMGTGFFLIGISILLFFVFNKVTKVVLKLSKKLCLWIKTRISRGRNIK